MEAAIYCRVSTEDQEREGTSLESQREACLKKAHEIGFRVDEKDIYAEAFSGLTLERPRLTQLRGAVRSGDVQAVIAYCLDRLSRDPVHFIILQEELEKAKVALILTAEDLDSSDMGKLIAHIKGYAAKLEATKIRERTTRGRRMRALSGKLPASSHARLYGYTYIPGKGVGEGIRYVNDEQAAVVRKMYQWCLEGLSTHAITYRLRDSGIPTPSGSGYWIRSTVQKILKNPAYCGKTFAFTCTYREPKRRLKPDSKRKCTGIVRKPKEEWIEIPNATPPIVSEDTYDAVQARLEHNRKMAKRNSKHEYLLHGHIYCAKCGRAYWAAPGIKTRNGKRYEYPFYHCSGKSKSVTPDRCENRRYSAKSIEGLIWGEVEKLLTQPELVFAELERRNEEDKTATWTTELERVRTLLANRQKQKDRVHRAFYVTGDEDLFRRSIGALARETEGLEKERLRLEECIASANKGQMDTDNLKVACLLVKNNLKTLSFEERRFALSVLQLRVIVDGNALIVQGAIPLSVGHLVTTERRSRHPAPRQGS